MINLLENPVVLAPMAGVSDKAWRIMARKYGCGMVYTEMISAKALTYHSTKTYDLLDNVDETEPIAVQLFGSEPHIMAEGARIAVEKGANILDINMGCPVPKVVKNNEGSALMCNPSLAGEIVREMCKAVSVPILVKMRIGWDEEHINAVEFAKILEDAGAALIAVHGRTRSQYYQGQANWDVIAQVKENVKIPVIANGDVFSPEDAKRILDVTSCDGVMIGRGALGKPWLYGQARDYITVGTYTPEPSIKEKIDIMLEHVRLCIGYKGEYVAIREMRHHVAWYCKGMRNSAKLRSAISQIDSYDALAELFQDYCKNQEIFQNDV